MRVKIFAQLTIKAFDGSLHSNLTDKHE